MKNYGKVVGRISMDDVIDGTLTIPDEIETFSLPEVAVTEEKVSNAIKKINLNKVQSVIASASYQGFSAIFPALEEIYAPKLSNINNFLFSGCTRLRVAEFDSARIIGVYSFENCTELKTIKLPNAKELYSAAFKNSGIEEFKVPDSLESIGMGAFAHTHLQHIELNKVKVVLSEAFIGCSGLKVISAKSIGVFRNLYSMAGVPNLNLLIVESIKNNERYPYSGAGNEFIIKSLKTKELVHCISSTEEDCVSKKFIQKVKVDDKIVYIFEDGTYAIKNKLDLAWNIKDISELKKRMIIM